jgi:acetyl/propionyl-CoA carboxylase alpha subunit
MTTSFDSMLAKLVVHGSDRAQAIARMRQALRDLVLLGIDHNAAYLERVLGHPEFAAAKVHTHFLEEHRDALALPPAGDADRLAIIACAALATRRAALDPPEPYAAIGPWRN